MKRISLRRARAVIAGTDKCPPLAPEWAVTDAELCERAGCDSPAEPEHTCPYRSDIHGDYDNLCNCCVDCQNACCMDT